VQGQLVERLEIAACLGYKIVRSVDASGLLRSNWCATSGASCRHEDQSFDGLKDDEANDEAGHGDKHLAEGATLIALLGAVSRHSHESEERTTACDGYQLRNQAKDHLSPP